LTSATEVFAPGIDDLLGMSGDATICRRKPALGRPVWAASMMPGSHQYMASPYGWGLWMCILGLSRDKRRRMMP
jgi:hypothetical protein